MFWQIQKRLIQNFNQFKSHCQRYRRSDRQRCHQLRLPFRKQHLFAQNWTFRQVRTDRSGYQPHYRKRPVERDQNLKITGHKNRPHATSRRRISIPLILIPYYPTIYQIHPYCRSLYYKYAYTIHLFCSALHSNSHSNHIIIIIGKPSEHCHRTGAHGWSGNCVVLDR